MIRAVDVDLGWPVSRCLLVLSFPPLVVKFSTLLQEALKVSTSSCDLLDGMWKSSPGFGAGVVGGCRGGVVIRVWKW